MKRILSIIISIVIIIVFYTIINGGLIGVQNVFKHDEKEDLKLLEDELLNEKSELENKETYLLSTRDELNSLEAEVKELEMIINNYESTYLYGIPDEYYEDYITTIDRYNFKLEEYNDLFDTHEQEYEEYNESIEKFNNKIVEAEKLAEEVGTTWVLLPFGGRH